MRSVEEEERRCMEPRRGEGGKRAAGVAVEGSKVRVGKDWTLGVGIKCP